MSDFVPLCSECGTLAHERDTVCKNCGAPLPTRPAVNTNPPHQGLSKRVRIVLVVVLVVSVVLIAVRAAQILTGRAGPKLVMASASAVLVNLSDFPGWNSTGVQVRSSSADANPAWRDFLFPDNSSTNYTLWVGSDASTARSKMEGIVTSWPYSSGPYDETGADASRELFYPRNLSSVGLVVLRYNVVYMEVVSGGPCQYPSASGSSLPSVGPAFCAFVDFGACPCPQLQKIESFAQYSG